MSRCAACDKVLASKEMLTEEPIYMGLCFVCRGAINNEEYNILTDKVYLLQEYELPDFLVNLINNT